jgi:hypothetical protein
MATARPSSAARGHGTRSRWSDLAFATLEIGSIKAAAIRRLLVPDISMNATKFIICEMQAALSEGGLAVHDREFLEGLDARLLFYGASTKLTVREGKRLSGLLVRLAQTGRRAPT